MERTKFYNAKVTKNFCKSRQQNRKQYASRIFEYSYDNAAKILYVPDSVTDDMPVAVKKI